MLLTQLAWETKKEREQPYGTNTGSIDYLRRYKKVRPGGRQDSCCVCRDDDARPHGACSWGGGMRRPLNTPACAAAPPACCRSS